MFSIATGKRMWQYRKIFQYCRDVQLSISLDPLYQCIPARSFKGESDRGKRKSAASSRWPKGPVPCWLFQNPTWKAKGLYRPLTQLTFPLHLNNEFNSAYCYTCADFHLNQQTLSLKTLPQGTCLKWLFGTSGSCNRKIRRKQEKVVDWAWVGKVNTYNSITYNSILITQTS